MFKQIACMSVAAMVATGCSTEENTAYQLSNDGLRKHVEVLSSDAFGGRAPGTRGEELTIQYLENAFRSMGLEPANGNSYIQNVPLASIETMDSPALTILGGEDALSFDYRTDQVIWTRREQTETSLSDSDLVFVGYGINAPERGWNDYEGIDVTGKTVVMLINDPGFATQDDAVFNGNSMTYYGRWGYKFDEAAKQGAAGALIIHQTKPAAYPWETVDSSWTGPQFDTVRTNKGANLAAVEGWITVEAADQLFTSAGLDRAALTQAAQLPGFKAVPMNLKASTSFNSQVNHVTSRNVAAMIKGSEAPDETFIYMAHWDHLGTDPTIDGDGIYNGALDNATGTGGLLELANLYVTAPNPPKRSVMFLAVTAEEQGLLGSAYYAANPLHPLAQTVAGLNMDGLNYYGPTSDITIVGYGNSELDDIIAEAASEQGRTLVADTEPEKGYFYRSDHFELAKFGVPMLYPNTGVTHKEFGRAYIEQKNAEYLANNYHKPSDEITDDWDFTGAVEDLQLYYNMGRMIVDSDIWPNWREGTEFKANRDKQRAGK
ncbi:M28 family metallopeptidase [Kordiimonas aquimaris]|uniref:M28 family metallopeptidase n=1 Tax=Kordiimonas aquimaris TaxID=707591 RepID=UPI0021CFF59D|nr:M28 family metallopeptidase [Kordiimonas aquimaris]